ncbi:sel1 repeat family protein [Caenispirillum bisanense]|uniref:Sel1 repeat-containing protein n=1 Tax=Caenispirillum bisanense TaxID=414052 RepID=A0A286G267_9PROT|nr:sel1 repeat family protein [Caenispirillum bisanense]SOD89573.1 hypothetical protein SAMN05421508_101264 [Caenispirillum bisanense]
MRTTMRSLRCFVLAAACGLAALPAFAAEAKPRPKDEPPPVTEREAILAPTLDGMFRDSLLRENDGRLPGYVQNRDGITLLGPAAPPPAPAPGFEPPQVVYEIEGPTPPPPWEEVVGAVARNAAEPAHVAEVERLADEGTPEAVELLAWMRANGSGVARDLPEAFKLYARAHQLGVPNARENAIAVYKSMSESEQQAARLPF